MAFIRVGNVYETFNNPQYQYHVLGCVHLFLDTFSKKIIMQEKRHNGTSTGVELLMRTPEFIEENFRLVHEGNPDDAIIIF